MATNGATMAVAPARAVSAATSGTGLHGPAAALGRLSRRITLLEGWRRLFVAFAAGGLVSFAHAPFDLPIVLFVSFPILVLLLDGIVPGERAGVLGRFVPPALLGWAFGFGMFWAAMWWIGNALVVSSGAPVWIVPFASAALAAVLALFPAAAVMLARQFWTQGLGRVLVLGAAWGIAEWARAHVATGFPWAAIGYAAMPVPILMQSVAVVGMDAMNVLTVWAAAGPALLADRRTRVWGVMVPAVLIAAHAAFGAWRLHEADRPAALATDPSGLRLSTDEPLAEPAMPLVRVVQPAVPQDLKWDVQQRFDIFRTLIDLSTEGAGAPDWIVWPETSIPFTLNNTPEALAVLGDALGDGQVLLAGGERGEGLGAERIRFNSMYAVDGAGRLMASRDKVHLVPFGEYLPFPDLLGRLGLRQLVAGIGDFTAATRRETLAMPGGAVILPLICYEAIFAHGLGHSGAAPDVIVNITNDAWFGATPGPYQHMRQARIRSVETGLPMVRAANDGVSAMVDPYGRIVDGLDHGVRGAFDARLPPKVAVNAISSRNLPWLWLLSGVAFAIVTVEAWRMRRSRKGAHGAGRHGG